MDRTSVSVASESSSDSSKHSRKSSHETRIKSKETFHSDPKWKALKDGQSQAGLQIEDHIEDGLANKTVPESQKELDSRYFLTQKTPPKTKKRKIVITPEFVNNTLSKDVPMCASSHPDASPEAALHSF